MKHKITAYDYKQAENNLISGDQTVKFQIRQELIAKKAKLDYFMSRFLEDHPEFQDCEKKKKFYTDKSEEYAQINRLLRIADAYR